MGWTEDHRNAVADRWREKYRQSGMCAADFSKHMQETLLGYGWEESDVQTMIERAVWRCKHET